MTLRCLSTYRRGPLHYNPGDLVYGAPGFEAFLLRDSPGSFAVWQPDPDPDPQPALTATVADRQERRGRRRA